MHNSSATQNCSTSTLERESTSSATVTAHGSAALPSSGFGDVVTARIAWVAAALMAVTGTYLLTGMH
ncbi:MAG: hypothetical protein JWQ43_2136 [Glaciihabitans sp.]|nr:hypothetical protein [Glaciihabitans sp.]